MIEYGWKIPKVESDSARIFCVSGVLQEGSRDNAVIKGAKEALLAQVQGLSRVYLDFTDLEYRFGDSIATIWTALLARKIEVIILAVGPTREAIESLMQHSGISVPITGAIL